MNIYEVKGVVYHNTLWHAIVQFVVDLQEI